MPIPHLEKQAQDAFEEACRQRFELDFRAKDFSIRVATEFNELEQAHHVDGGYRAMSTMELRDDAKLTHFARGKTRGQAIAEVLRQAIPILETLDLEAPCA